MADHNKLDVEANQPEPGMFGHWTMIMDQGAVNAYVLQHQYQGSGTEEDPYVVVWLPHDPRNPMRFSQFKKWTITFVVALATLAVAFVSSAFSGGIEELMEQFDASQELITLGLTLYVLGFAVGPLVWAPLSELFGRQVIFFFTYAALSFFNAGSAGSQNIWTLLILRFFAGSFGSSPLTNAGGVLADMFAAEQRGVALSMFAAAPFLGPVLGPIVGGFVGETIGWRWIQGIMAIFTGVVWIMGTLYVPETYSPTLLRQRARRLSYLTGKVYKSKGDKETGQLTIVHAFKMSLSRPWILLFSEPIVFLLSLYMAIIYGTLYMLFGAFPIVYQVERGWSAGVGGLAFLGVAVGMVLAVVYSIIDNSRYVKVARNSPGGFAPPETRLPPCIVGGIAVPIGLFWFAWTNYPSIHWLASIAAGVPFGFGMVLVFLAIMNYLIDAYVIFAASVLAANSVLRSIFGAVFPLFTDQMFHNLGIHWASSIPAFLALACLPFPFLFYRYGPAIRQRCKFAAQADAFMRRMREQDEPAPADDSASGEGDSEKAEIRREAEEDREQEAIDYSYDDESQMVPYPDEGRFQRIRSAGQARPPRPRSQTYDSRPRSVIYEGNPFDLDRVNTRDSFVRVDSHSRPGSLRSKKSLKDLRRKSGGVWE